MLHEELLPVLLETLADVLSVEIAEITLESSLVDDFNMETLAAVQVIVALEKRYDIKVDVQRARRARTVGELLAMLTELVHSQRGTA